MLAHLSLHRVNRAVLGFVLALGFAGCASATPQLNVLGVSDTGSNARSSEHTMVVFVEVVNPTGRDLELSRLTYELEASSWFLANGDVSLSREIPQGSSAVVEIPVRVQDVAGTGAEGVPYELRGRIYARDDRVIRSWSVKVRGALASPGNATAPTLRIYPTAEPSL